MKFWKRVFALTFIIGELFCVQAFALPNIDRTCKTCERRYLDSLNVYNRRPIRINQSGFRPQDYKYAYVADPGNATTFKVIDAATGKEVSGGGNLTFIGNVVKPGMWVNGAFNSLNSLYDFNFYKDTTEVGTEKLYRADFTTLSTQGEYYIVVGNDTSSTFHVHPSIYNAILENALQFFGIQRCGNTKSHFHAACHLKDGSAISHDLTGGWHDCGDHFKVSETLGYTAYVLSMVYLTYQDKAEDRYGNSYADTVITDGIPDILYEAHIGADYILKLYEASKADGLLDKADMYHSVGVDEVDHSFWDVPEHQDAQPASKGGPDRIILKGIGANTSGMFVAALANIAVGYRPFDPLYADSLLRAAKDIYKKVMMPAFTEGRNTSFPGFYTGGGPLFDDAAAAALALWYATADTTYRYDLYKNKALNDNESNYHFNMDYFKAGFLGHTSGFTPGGWATDYQNIHSYVLFALQKLILDDEDKAINVYGLTPQERDTLSMRTMATFRKLIDNSTNEGDSTVLENPATTAEPHEGSTKLHVIKPYNLVWTSFDWGVIRYNLGTAVSIFLMYELTKDERYLRVALDNMYFALGANPWDISLLMGAGEKNPQHPHNRSANPDGYNAGSMPYEYRCPRGALMGGRDPNKTLIEDWSSYTSTETCIDFSAQFLFPAQSLAETLPIDAEGPLFSNIAGTPITDTSAIISWDANEVSLVTVFYNTTPDEMSAKFVQQTKASKGGAVTINGLQMGQTYYFFLEGIDTKNNMSTDDNHGQWYQFTMTPATTTISGVTICQVDNRSAKIYWWSSDRMNGVVNYGTTSSLGSAQTAEGGAVMFHEATLTNLKAGTTYYFSVSSGATTDDNSGKFYSFTTEQYSVYADLNIYVKPSSYQTPCSAWEDCQQFIMSIANKDTMAFHDFEIRFYLGSSANFQSISWMPLTQNWRGTGQMTSIKSIEFGQPTLDGSEYYLPITIKDTLDVSGQMLFQIKFTIGTYKDFAKGWSIREHISSDDPEQFKGIDLTLGPLFMGSETEQLERNANGEKVIAFTRDPYVPVYYHGKHIYGYGPNDTPDSGPQVRRVVSLNFESPFVSPLYSVEKVDSRTIYQGESKVTPSGVLDDLEINAQSVFNIAMYDPATRKDSYVFNLDTALAYGNNYMEWVSWHNHGANKSGSYDCACAYVRSNVEIDTITTPPEEFYLVYTIDTVKAYTGKLAEVHLQLLDSTHTLFTAERVSILMNSKNGLAKFFSQIDATVSSGDGFKVDIVNGEAVFYVSADLAMETELIAVGPNSSTKHYNTRNALLIIEDLPPWPIIDIAKMIDTDCDGVPDAFDITLSNAYISAEGQSFNSIRFVYGTDTLTSTKVISQNDRQLMVDAGITNKTINTAPTGSITLVSNTKEGIKPEPGFYQDGIAPTLISVSVLERLDTATSDRIYFQFSEPIQAPGLEWPVKLYPNDNAVTVRAAKLYRDDLNIWEYEIAFDAGNGSIVKDGMEAQLLSSSPIRDLAGNSISTTCSQPKLPILLKILPVPMTYASISDKNEDGLAEFVNIQFSRTVDAKHIPDSLSVIFGSVQPETLTVAGSILAFGENGSGTITLPTPFALGNTNGPYEGAINGRTLAGAGMVTQHLGAGAAYESNDVLAEDLAGPIFTSASLNSNAIEILSIFASEPLNITDSTNILYQRERANVSVRNTHISSWTLAQENRVIRSVYSADAEFAVIEGDRLRFAPGMQSAFIDKNGNMPIENNPWVTVGGESTPKIKYNVRLAQNVTLVDPTLATDFSDKTIRFYIVNPTTHKLDLIENGNIVQVGRDTTVLPLNGVIWKFDLSVPRGAAFNEPAAWSQLKLKYNMPIYTNLGAYVNRLSGTYNISSSNYLSSDNKVTFFVEWTNAPSVGVRAYNGRAAGTGAYIYKAEFDAKFTPNAEKEPNVQKRFSTKSSYDKTEVFGIRRK